MSDAKTSVEIVDNPRDPHWGFPALPSWVTGFRPSQLTAATEIVDAFDRGQRIVIFEGPTGSGKTLVAEMVRRLLQAPRTLYVCNGIALQDQFLRDFDYAELIKSARNYPTLNEPFPAVSCQDCDRTKDAGMWECSWCDPADDCPYQTAKRSAMVSPLVVTNTAYALHTWRHAHGLSGRDLVIVDECDTLESILMGFVEFRLTGGLLKRLRVRAPNKGCHKKTILSWMSNELSEAIGHAGSQLGGRINDAGDVKKIRWRGQLKRLRDQAQHVAESLAEDETNWVRDNSKDPLVLKPVNVAPYAAEALWAHGKRWLLMSATVISADQMVRDLGVEERAQ